MLRVRISGLLITISFAALLAGAVASFGQGLTEPATPGWRAETDDNLPTALRRPDRTGTKARPDARKLPLQLGTPSGSGAGKTGFKSTNAPRAAQPPGRKPAASATVAGKSTKAPATERRRRAPPAPTAPTTYVPRPAPPVPAPLPPPVPGPSAGISPPPVPTPPVRRAVRPEEDPFAPTGVRVGSFEVRPAVDLTGGYDTNPNRSLGGRGSALGTVAPELLVRSDWSRHEFSASLRGSYTAYEAVPSLNRPFFDGRFLGRIDVTRNTRIDLEARSLVSTDYAGSPDLTAGFARLPIYTSVGGTIGVAHRFNRLELAVKGSADRISYEDTLLTNGNIASNQDRNYHQFGLLARASYELTPGVKPFVEATIDSRIRDLSVDRFGVRRDSEGAAARAGTTFEFTRTLTGEVSAGYVMRTYKDPSLPDLRGLTLDGLLIWAASGLTTVKLTASTKADESTLPGVAGVLRRDVSMQVDHAFRRWFIGTARVGYGEDIYEGATRDDKRYLAALALTYKFSREWQVRGELRREWLRSNQPGADYVTDIALLGLRWQR